MSKLNFWQWLGVVLLIIGIVMYIARNTGDQTVPAPTTPTTQPAPAPTAAPGQGLMGGTQTAPSATPETPATGPTTNPQ